MEQTTDLKVVEEQGRVEYGDADYLTSEWTSQNAELLAAAGPRAFHLIMIHHKLMRALYSPSNNDHFVDIRGYAARAMGREVITADSLIDAEFATIFGAMKEMATK